MVALSAYRSRLTLLFLVLGLFGAFAQVEVKGIVVFDDKPVVGASVFLSGTTYGTVSNDTGEFLLEVPEGKYSLVVSHLGFKNVVYELNTAELPERLKVVMEEGEIALKEVVLEGKMSAEDRAYFLNQFKSEFIGRGLFSSQCKLLNPDDLRFSYDRQSGTLRVYADKALILRNMALGYEINYSLEYFAQQGLQTSFLGYSRYTPLKGNKRKQKQWMQNRLRAYAGSRRHFFSAIANRRSTVEGFLISQFVRKRNPLYPTEKELERAKAVLRKVGTLNFSSRNQKPKTAADSAGVIIRRSREVSKMVDQVYAVGIPDSLLFRKYDGKTVFQFDDNLRVSYSAQGTPFESDEMPKRTLESIVIPLSQPNTILPSGVLEVPLNVFYEGHWSTEKMAVSLPLNYRPFEE